ncbi:MAG: hypothetical protein NTY80_01940 [candidate division SR1 bacterium]|nr:hypothetical protein [candidate division SR1 bacterium]
MDATLLTTLQNYGLSDKEARVYLTVLELGTSIASTIARRAELNRVTVYTVLEEMIKEAVILSETINNIKYYTAVHPETLSKNFENKYLSIKESLPQLLEIMGKFTSIKKGNGVESRKAGEEAIKRSERESITTASLQKKFPSVYKKFFKENDMVLSGTSVFTRGGGVGISGKFNIKQKLPTKVYVGISYTKNPQDISFATICEYDMLADAFHEHDMKQEHKYVSVIEELQDFFKKNKIKKGIKISVIMESTQGQGTGYTSVILTVVSTILHALSGELKSMLLQDYKKFLASSVYKEIFDYAIKLTHLTTNKNAYGANSYAVLAHTKKPILYTQIDGDKKTYFAQKMDVLLGSDQKNIFELLPLDYGFITLGGGYDSQMRISVRQNFEHIMKENKEKMFQIFKDNKVTEKQLKEIFDDVYTLDFGQQFKNIFTIFKFNIILGFKNILQYPHDEDKIEEFVRLFNNYAEFSDIIESEPQIIKLIRKYFEKYKIFPDEVLGIFPISAGKEGGSYGFVMKYRKSRQTLEKVFEVLKKEGHKNMGVAYANWIDGYCNEGIIVEKI